MLISNIESQSTDSTFADSFVRRSSGDEAWSTNTGDNATPPAFDQDMTDDRANTDQTCPKCNERKASTEFVSDKTGRPTVK